jgi:PQQ-dependent dehydrogenase (methanol/ethanol family)
MARVVRARGRTVLAAACGALCAALASSACSRAPERAEAHVQRAAARRVDDARLRAAADEPGAWLTHGRTWSEQRYSPLAQIDERSVARLGLAWSYDLETTRGVEATPLVADGVMYVSAPYGVVHALDARSGERRWTWDPGAGPRLRSRATCCDAVNRGVALYEGRVYVGTLDGRLVALDAATGEPAWDVLTIDPAQPYSITGAPRVVGGRVIIGNGGAEFGVRGYVSAYDARDGRLLWRTYTVPGNPAQGFESPALERAAKTWTGEWWTLGGGGTVWDAIAYDPDLDLLYVGTGNGSPHVRWLRSPQGGDNLYLASILALRPATGELVWHFQTTPADTWDYTATQPIVLADLELDGRVRKVLMQAPKNGFFYVLDRETGEFLSGTPLVKVTWASGLDARGRPHEEPAADYRGAGGWVSPGVFGGHNWHPMSFSPQTGLVYIPAHEMPAYYKPDPNFAPERGTMNTGMDYSMFVHGSDQKIEAAGALVAWDPVRRRAAWRVPHPTPWNGGTLATAGNLVFQGTATGRFVAYRATDGAKLWEAPAGTAVMAGPVSYAIDGVHYVAVAAGWGSGFANSAGPVALAAGVRGGGRVLAYALDATGVPPPATPPAGPVPPPPLRLDASADEVERGGHLYARYCLACHGPLAIGGGSLPDLRYASAETHARFAEIVVGGALAARGMPGFADALSAADARAIQAYVLGLAASAAREPAPRAR